LKKEKAMEELEKETWGHCSSEEAASVATAFPDRWTMAVISR